MKDEMSYPEDVSAGIDFYLTGPALSQDVMPSERRERGHPNKRQNGEVTTKPAGALQQSRLSRLCRSPRRACGPPRDDAPLRAGICEKCGQTICGGGCRGRTFGASRPRKRNYMVCTPRHSFDELRKHSGAARRPRTQILRHFVPQNDKMVDAHRRAKALRGTTPG